MFKKFMSLCAVLAVSFLMVSCGSGPSSVAKDAKAAAEKGDAAAFKACFTEKDAKKLDGVTAQMAMGMMKEAEIGAETVDGDKGTIEMTWKGQTQKIPCVKENGEWKLSN